MRVVGTYLVGKGSELAHDDAVVTADNEFGRVILTCTVCGLGFDEHPPTEEEWEWMDDDEPIPFHQGQWSGRVHTWDRWGNGDEFDVEPEADYLVLREGLPSLVYAECGVDGSVDAVFLIGPFSSDDEASAFMDEYPDDESLLDMHVAVITSPESALT